MREVLKSIILLMLLQVSCGPKPAPTEMIEADLITESVIRADAQLSAAIREYPDTRRFPRSTLPDGSLRTVDSADWVSGFFPGSLWLMYALQGENKWKDAAIRWTESLSAQQFNISTHDIGFVINCSYGNGFKLVEDKSYEQTILQAARSLMTRYSEKVGCTKSWDWSSEWRFPVIIDNMMNLELLFVASRISGDAAFRNAAIQHARTTMKHHYREDFSSYHLVDYDPQTGRVRKKMTHQGIGDESAWARGQAWGLYGFSMCYRESGEPEFLEQAQKIADFIMNHSRTPDDRIPYWDYDAPGIPDEPRDASAAAIIASALLELSTVSSTDSEEYFRWAESILKSLSSEKYLAAAGTNNNFLLKHCTGNKPDNSEIDGPLAYGDYYFLEALLRYRRIKAGSN